MKRHVLYTLFLAIVITLAFGSSLKIPFFLDDYAHLSMLDHPDKGLKYSGYNTYSSCILPDSDLRDFLPWWIDVENRAFEVAYFRPIPTISMALDLALWGKDSRAFHGTNLFLHVLCVLLLYGFSVTQGLRPAYAFMGCLAAGLHPNLLFSVSWVCNRDNSISAILLIAVLWTYDVYLRNSLVGEKSEVKTLALAAAFLFLALGILSKENFVLVPALLLVLTWVRAARWNNTEKALSRSIRYLPLLPFFLVSILYVCWYSLTGRSTNATYLVLSTEKGLGENLAFMAKNIYFYLVSFVFFLPPDFEDVRNIVLTWPFGLASALLLGTLTGLIFWKRNLFRTLPALWLFLGWFLAFLFIPLWFTPLGRFLYVSTMGYGIFIVLFVQGFSDQLSKKRWKACLIGPMVLWLILVPFVLTSLFVAFVAEKGNQTLDDMNLAFAAMDKDLSPGATIFLINTPLPVTAYMADVVHLFYHPDTGTRIYPLGNAERPPEIHNVSTHGFCLSDPEGIIALNRIIPAVPLEVGTEIKGPRCQARITQAAQGIPKEACFSFSKPLNSPDFAFFAFDPGNGDPRRINFQEEMPLEITK